MSPSFLHRGLLIGTVLTCCLHSETVGGSGHEERLTQTEPVARRDWPVVVREDFEHGASRWEPTDASAWRIIQTARGAAFNQFKQSEYAPPHRSPRNIAWLRDMHVGDFVFQAELQSTKKDYPHRDMCLFFGYQNASRFYYVHFGKKTDDHANQIFIVNDAPRIKISHKTTPGTDWDDGWHRVRIVRHTNDGSIRVFFDDMDHPVMEATDKTFSWGRVGIGSFDDTGNWNRVVLRGVKVDPEK